MKKLILLLIILISIKGNANPNNTTIDSTNSILNEWLNFASTDDFFNHMNIRGVSKAEYAMDLKLIEQSIAAYQSGKYINSIENINKIIKINNFPEVERMKLFILTMSKIKLQQHFKARKWYYVSKNKMTSSSFVRLQKNVENQKLSYNINNYKKVRGGRIAALAIGGGFLMALGTISGE